jgi:hypothetical protein
MTMGDVMRRYPQPVQQLVALLTKPDIKGKGKHARLKEWHEDIDAGKFGRILAALDVTAPCIQHCQALLTDLKAMSGLHGGDKEPDLDALGWRRRVALSALYVTALKAVHGGACAAHLLGCSM